MLPPLFVFLEALPLTTSGKLNRKALPAPDHSRPQLQEAMVFAQSPVEKRLAEIWCEFLGIEQVGIHDTSSSSEAIRSSAFKWLRGRIRRACISLRTSFLNIKPSPSSPQSWTS